MNKIPTRRERRASMKHQGVFKIKNKLPLGKKLELTKETLKRGKEINTVNKDTFEKSITEQMEDIEVKLIEGWVEQGYSTDEIKKLREAWSKLNLSYSKASPHDKKIARNLIKEVNKTRTYRVNG